MLRRVLLMNSGGPDCACIAAVLNKGNVLARSLFLNVNQASLATASVAARRTAEKWCDEHDERVVDFGKSTTQERIISGVSTRVQMHSPAPFLMAYASVYAHLHNFEDVYLGINGPEIDPVSGDRPLDWDLQMKSLLKYHEDPKQAVNFHLPLWSINKSLECEWAGIQPMELIHTVTCSSEIRDDSCAKCLDRRKAGIPVE